MASRARSPRARRRSAVHYGITRQRARVLRQRGGSRRRIPRSTTDIMNPANLAESRRAGPRCDRAPGPRLCSSRRGDIAGFIVYNLGYRRPVAVLVRRLRSPERRLALSAGSARAISTGRPRAGCWPRRMRLSRGSARGRAGTSRRRTGSRAETTRRAVSAFRVQASTSMLRGGLRPQRHCQPARRCVTAASAGSTARARTARLAASGRSAASGARGARSRRPREGLRPAARSRIWSPWTSTNRRYAANPLDHRRRRRPRTPCAAPARPPWTSVPK